MFGRVVYEDALVTEYADGTEEVRFTDAEYEAMRKDPVYYGYSCPRGHSIREDDPFYQAEGCPKCFAEAESWDYEADEPGIVIPADFPLVRCGKCKTNHVGVGAVRRCFTS